jgi:peptidoglycan/xylan/chitin deacetylase (PgdA/CDA1 family)
MYHRVAVSDLDPWSLCVSPGHFAEHLELLRDRYRPMPLTALAADLRRGRLTSRAVAVTLDDGYADNLHAAASRLERAGVPATVFITSGAIGSRREFWWDELERILLERHEVPDVLRVAVGGVEREWSLDDDAAQAPDERGRHARWRADQLPPTRRHAAYLELWSALYPLDSGEKGRVLRVLREWAGVGEVARPSHRALTPDEVAELARTPGLEIGAHGVTHDPLSARPRDAQEREIAGSVTALASLLNRDVVSFAFPHGAHDGTTLDLLRRARIGTACTTRADSVTRTCDPLALPRIHVHDWSADALDAVLRWWLER